MVLWFVFVSSGLPTFAETLLPGLELDPRSGIDIKITSDFKQLPPVGFAPMQILIRNHSGRSQSWSFQFTSSASWNSFATSREFAVEDNGERTFEVLVPLATNENKTYSNSNVQITVSGYGVTRGFANQYSGSSSGHPLTDYVLMSKALALHSWGPLEKACEDWPPPPPPDNSPAPLPLSGKIKPRPSAPAKNPKSLNGCEFNPAFLPTDWRGYLGVGSMWITDSEWQALDAGPRNAIREWVAQGGNLMICSTAPRTPGDFGFHDSLPGYGVAGMVAWDGKELGVEKVMAVIAGRENSLVTHLGDGYQANWNLPGAIGYLPLNAGFIIGFVILFAAVVGPLNLFWLAKSGQRHRLFWTTPLISLAGSAALAIVIVLQDGFGGNGNRLIAVHLMPDEKEAVVVQEQVSRTGLLISPHFKSDEKMFLAPVGTQFVRSPGRRSTTIRYRNRRYNADETAYSGDWFASRSVQAQFVETIRPTRARVEVGGGGNGEAPALLSSIENNLHQVFYIDARGRYWQTGPLRVGEKKTLQPSNEKEFDHWWTSTTHDAGERARYLLDHAKTRKGYFYATADASKSEGVPTMPSIRWNNQKAIYLGACPEEPSLTADH